MGREDTTETPLLSSVFHEIKKPEHFYHDSLCIFFHSFFRMAIARMPTDGATHRELRDF